MPYTAGGNQSGQILAQGINGLFAGVQDYAKRQEEARKEAEQLQYDNQQNQIILQHALKNNQISQEDYTSWMQKPPKQQKAIAAGLASNIMSDAVLKKNAADQANAGARNLAERAAAAHNYASANNLNNPPPPPKHYVSERAGKTAFDANGKAVGVYDEQGDISRTPAGEAGSSDEPIKFDPLVDPGTGKPVQGFAVNRKTGAVIPTTSGEDKKPILDDPNNPNFYLNGHTHSWEPLDAATRMSILGAKTPVEPPKIGFFDAIKAKMAGTTPGGVTVDAGKSPARPNRPDSTVITPNVPTPPDGQVNIYKNGNLVGHLPQGQLQDAVSQGYTTHP